MKLYSLGFFLLLLAASAGCSDTVDFNACADIGCGGHGACVVEQGAPTCKCDPGYSPAANGWLCIDTSERSPCAGVTCSGRGTCLALGGSPVCQCTAGYKRSADGLKCLDPCQGMLCSGVGTCFVDKGKARCSCPSGYWVTADGKGCHSTALGGCTTYYLSWDSYPTYYRGMISLDSRKWSKGLLVERYKQNVYLDYGGRGLLSQAASAPSTSSSGGTGSSRGRP